MNETTHHGIIQGGAVVAFGDLNAIRLLVTISDDDWTYLYIRATNYKFRIGDPVSWNHEGAIFWYCHGRITRFDLLNVALQIQ